MVVTGCGFADLRPVTVSTSPSDMNAVLPTNKTPVIVNFSAEMMRIESESAVRITSDAGAALYDAAWQGNSLYCTPVPSWTPGVRYVLSLSGTVYAADGRELQTAASVPFFAVSASPAPVVVSFSPENTASVGVNAEYGANITVRFSEPMDRKSVETAFSWDTGSEKIFSWADNDTLFTVSAPKPLSPWTVCRWSIGAGAASAVGVPLYREVKAYFVTDADRSRPAVERVYPVLWSNGAWVDALRPIETGFTADTSIFISFNKDMDTESVRRAIRIEPSLSGRVEEISASRFVFIPETAPKIGERYALIISADTADISGLKLGSEYRVYFTPDIPFLRVMSLSSANMTLTTAPDPRNGAEFTVNIVKTGAGGVGILSVRLRFSLGFTEKAKLDLPFLVSLSGFFPDILTPVSLQSAHWTSADTLSLTWNGVKGGSAAEPYYYKLTLPGGINGAANGRGSYFQDELSFYFKAVSP